MLSIYQTEKATNEKVFRQMNKGRCYKIIKHGRLEYMQTTATDNLSNINRKRNAGRRKQEIGLWSTIQLLGLQHPHQHP